MLQDQTFKSLEDLQLEAGATDFENCRFESCDFSNKDLSDLNFMDCLFKDCDLGNSTIQRTGFKNVKFDNCKMIGLHFSDVNPILLKLTFTECQINYSSFYNLELINTPFIRCLLHEVDFVGAALSNSIFDECDLRGSQFENTDLRNVDFTTSIGIDLDLTVNNLTGAKFSLGHAQSLLTQFGIIIG